MFVTALFQTESGLLHLSRNGETATIVRDTQRQLEISLHTVDHSVLPHSSRVVPDAVLMAAPWITEAFFLEVNGVAHSDGPVVLESKDVLKLCKPGEADKEKFAFRVLSDHDFHLWKESSHILTDPPNTEETAYEEREREQRERKEQLWRAQECIHEVSKWMNYYSYRFALPEDRPGEEEEMQQSFLLHYYGSSEVGARGGNRVMVSHITVPNELILSAASGVYPEALTGDCREQSGAPRRCSIRKHLSDDEVIQQLRQNAYAAFPGEEDREEEEEQEENEKLVSGAGGPLFDSPWSAYHDQRHQFCTERLLQLSGEKTEITEKEGGVDGVENLNEIQSLMRRIRNMESVISNISYF